MDGQRVSTLDLFGEGFCVLSASDSWCDAARALSVDAHQISDPAWQDRYGVGAGGAVLVRPDGHVAWRSPTPASDPVGELRGILTRLLGQEVVFTTSTFSRRRRSTAGVMIAR